MITQKRQASTEAFRPKYGMNALILRYNEALQKVIGAKTKPEPWLHCAMADDGEHNYYAIYVWDTRKVIEEGRTAIDTMNVERSKGIVHANDNKQPLDGLKSDVVAKLFRKGAGNAKPGHEHMPDNIGIEAAFKPNDNDYVLVSQPYQISSRPAQMPLPDDPWQQAILVRKTFKSKKDAEQYMQDERQKFKAKVDAAKDEDARYKLYRRATALVTNEKPGIAMKYGEFAKQQAANAKAIKAAQGKASKARAKYKDDYLHRP